jgi:hypothetical protein
VILVEEEECGLHPPRREGLVSGTRQDPRARGCDQWRVSHRGRVTIVAGRGDFRRPGRPGHADGPGHSPTPKVSSGGLAGGWSHFGGPTRSAGLQHWFMGLR